MKQQEKHLLIRADAGIQIGTGHIMRCLALAQAWKDAGGQVTFITACQSDDLLQRLREEGFNIHILAHPYPDPGDWDYTKDILAANPNAWVVLDGYNFDEVYQQRVKDTGHRLLVIDDTAHLKHYYADIILNQNLHAEQLSYSYEPYTHLLLGTRYVLLRREFLAWRGWKREVTKIARKVLVTIGGGDPKNHTLKVIKAFQRIDAPGLEAIVVIGAINPHADELEAAIRQSRIPIRLIRNATNMPELMTWSDVAISTAGTTAWELAFMGVPAALCIQADNQRKVAEELSLASTAVSLGRTHRIGIPELVENLEALLRDSKRRRSMVERIKVLVDGEGVNRVMMHIKGEKLILRPVGDEDCRLLWEWANDPDVRAAAFSSESIPWEEHIKWFTHKLNDPHCFHFIALDDQDTPVGQARIDVHGEEAEIDTSVDRQRRGCGFGSSLIETAVEKVFRITLVKVVHAYVKPQNKVSIHAFRKAGFQDSGLGVMRRHQVPHLIKVRSDG